jgi:hypothetical protein
VSTVIQMPALPKVWIPPVAKPLDEAVWQACRRGRQEMCGVLEGCRSGSAGVLASAGSWSHLGSYDVLVRFAVVTGALTLMVPSFHARQYAFTAVFGILALLYNPIAPVIGFSGGWQRAFVVASAAPFLIAALVRRTARSAGK